MCFDSSNINNLIDLAKIVLPLFLVTFLTYRYTLRQLKVKYRMDFIERQLRELYSPLTGCKMKIKSESELRDKIFMATDLKWREFCKTHPEPTEEDFKPFQNSVIYDRTQFREEIIPLYDKMVAIFTDNYYLAETDTKKWYKELLNFVEIWHRYIKEAIPREVIPELKHTEENLESLYLDLDFQIDKLKKELSNR